MAKSRTAIAKIVFILCNIVFLIMGICMVTMGAYLQISQSSYIDLLPSDEFFTGTALLLASGTIVIVVCLFGFIGVWMESQCILLIYFLCVIIILALSVAAGILAYIFHGEIEMELKEKLLEGLKDPKLTKHWDEIQSVERCCGVHNYTDWYGIADTDYPTAVPDSCCDGPNCGLQGKTVAYDQSCYDKGKDWVKDNFYALGVTGLVLGILQIILLASALCLIITLRREKMIY